MTDTAARPALRDLVRPEALERHSRGSGPGRILGIDHRRTTWAFRLLLVGLLGAAAATTVVDVEETTEGRAVVDDGAVDIVVRSGVQGRLRPGLPVRLALGGRRVDGRIVRVGPPVRAAEVEREVGGLPAGVGRDEIVATAIVGVASGPALDDRTTGSVTVRLSRRSIASTFLRRSAEG